MKIAFDPQIFTLQAYGGISRYFINLSRSLSVLGQSPRTFAPLHMNKYLAALNDVSVAGRYIGTYPRRTGRFFRLLNQVLAVRPIQRWHPDIVHETYYSTFRPVFKLPLVVTVYDMIHELYPQYFSRLDPTPRAKRIAVSRADHVICISENTRKDLLNLYDIDSDKVSVVHLGFASLSDTGQNVVVLDSPFILYVGQRSGYKNFENFVRAYASSDRLVRDFSLVAFGGGPFSRKERDLFDALKLNPGRCIHVSGGDGLLGHLYRKAACFVYPSLYEGFGLPPLEAMSVGCPVISSNTSSMPEVIGDAGALFDPLSIDSMRNTIESVVYSKVRTEELIQKGGERVKMFTWKDCAAKTLEAYRKCL